MLITIMPGVLEAGGDFEPPARVEIPLSARE
jgi:hypothetical protein